MSAPSEKVNEFLKPTAYVDSDADNVVAFARRVTNGVADPVKRAVALYYAVRDEITYTPYCDFRSVETYRASACLARGSGFCVAKAALLAASARAEDIPARVGFADVRNHLASPRLKKLMNTDVFYYHGYAELYLDGTWVKATAVFDTQPVRALRRAAPRVRRAPRLAVPPVRHRRAAPHGVRPRPRRERRRPRRGDHGDL